MNTDEQRTNVTRFPAAVEKKNIWAWVSVSMLAAFILGALLSPIFTRAPPPALVGHPVLAPPSAEYTHFIKFSNTIVCAMSGEGILCTDAGMREGRMPEHDMKFVAPCLYVPGAVLCSEPTKKPTT